MRTAFKETLRNIRKNIVNFISLTVFVFLAVTLFEGLDFTGTAVLKSVEDTFRASNAYDIKVRTGSYFDQGVVDSFLNIEGIDQAEGYFALSDDLLFDGKTYSSSIISLTDRITRPVNVRGRLPEKDDEIAVYEITYKQIGIDVGDTVSFVRDNLTGFATASLKKMTQGYQPVELASESSRNFKHEELKVTAVVSYPDTINSEPGAFPLDDRTLVNTKAGFLAPLNSFNPFIRSNRFNGVYLRSDSLRSYPYNDKIYKEKASELSEKVREYLDSEIDLSHDYLDVVDSDQSTHDYIVLFLVASGYLDSSLIGNSDAVDGAIGDWLSQVASLESTKIVNVRSDIVGTVMAKVLSDLFVDDRFAIGGVFFVISLLICYSLITRLVHDDAKLIGAKKALGFRPREIRGYYLGFSLLATFIGLLLGNIAAFGVEAVLIPVVLRTSFQVIYHRSYFNIALALVIAILMVALIYLITAFACSGILKKRATDLLQGNLDSKRKSSNSGKKPFLSRLPLFYRTVIRNFRKDIKRVFATIVGISSSIALLMSSFSLRLTASNSFDKMFGEHILFDTIVMMDTSVAGSSGNLVTYFEDKEIDYCPIYREFVTLSMDGHDTIVGYTFVYFDDALFNRLVNIDPSDGNPSFQNSGFWFPESYQKEYGCKNESPISVSTQSGTTFEASTSGFYRYYNYRLTIFVDADSYQAATGEEVRPNAYIIDRGRGSIDEFENAISSVNGYLYSYDFYGKGLEDIAIFDLVLSVIYTLYLVAALMLAVFVILNLFLTNVKEKKREVLTLMTNGYSRKTASRYVYLDTIFLTLVSIVFGTILGVFLGWFGQVSIESKFLYLIHAVNIPSMLIGNILTIVLVFLMSMIALSKIKKFRLTDANNA